MHHFRFQVCFCKNTATILTSLTLATCDFVYRGPLFFVEFALGFMLFYAALYDLCFAHFCLHLVMSIRIVNSYAKLPPEVHNICYRISSLNTRLHSVPTSFNIFSVFIQLQTEIRALIIFLWPPKCRPKFGSIQPTFKSGQFSNFHFAFPDLSSFSSCHLWWTYLIITQIRGFHGSQMTALSIATSFSKALAAVGQVFPKTLFSMWRWRTYFPTYISHFPQSSSSPLFEMNIVLLRKIQFPNFPNAKIN